MDTQQLIDHYMRLPYTFELIPEPGGGWFVAVKELAGCMSEGETPEDAMAMIRDAMRGWIEAALEDGDPIPEPRDVGSYSGKFVVRLPRSLHRQLVELADDQDTSLNQLVNVALAQYLGHASRSAHERQVQPANRPDVARGLATDPARSSAAAGPPAMVKSATAAAHPVTQVADEKPQWSQTKSRQRVRREPE